MAATWWWIKVLALGSLAAWMLAGIITVVLAVAGQEAPRAVANACVVVAGVFAAGVVFRFGGSVLRHSRTLKESQPPEDHEDRGPPPPRSELSRPQRLGMSAPPRSDRASLAFAVLATLVMIEVLVLGFVVGSRA
ncbi:MAG: hypothetical protein QOF16_978 [Actinomycetota bacterium]|nr:hypothetical protein [Actinomycetota bacterium]